jgi:hypothetical protein
MNLCIGFHFLSGFSAYDGGIEYCSQLFSVAGNSDTWKYNPQSIADCESQADNMITTYHEVADRFFSRYCAFPSSFTQLTLHDLEFGPTSSLPPRPFRNVARDCLVLMHVWHFLEDFDRARQFAEAGVRHADNAVKLRSRFESYLASRVFEAEQSAEPEWRNSRN